MQGMTTTFLRSPPLLEFQCLLLEVTLIRQEIVPDYFHFDHEIKLERRTKA